MQIHSDLSYGTYLQAMRNRLGSFLDFGHERFTGFIIGRFFSITHHAGYEFNRRITNERNSAVGFVKKTAEGVLVRYIRLKGWTTPQALLLSFLMWLVFSLFRGMGTVDLGFAALLSLGMTAAMALISAFFDTVTERGEQGEREMFALLYDPTNPIAYLDHH